MKPQSKGISYGPLQALMNDPAVQEVAVNAPDEILVSRSGKLEYPSKPRFKNAAEIQKLITGLLKHAGRSATPQPFSDFRLADGTRVTAAMAPLSPSGPVLVLQRPPQKTLSWEELEKFGALTADGKRIFEAIIATGKGFLIAGSQNSGKYTVAGRVLDLIPAQQRMIVLENAAGLSLTRKGVVRIQSSAEHGFTAQDLLTRFPLLRPDWVAADLDDFPREADLLTLVDQGISVAGLLQASSARDAFQRVALRAAGARVGMAFSEVCRILAGGIGFISHQRLCADRTRRITEICRVEADENGEPRFTPLFHYDEEAKGFRVTDEGRALLG